MIWTKAPWLCSMLIFWGVSVAIGGFKCSLLSPWNLGKWSNLMNMFQMVWNHQLVDVLYTLSETNISHLEKRKIIFKSALKRGYVSSLEGSTSFLLERKWKVGISCWICFMGDEDSGCLKYLAKNLTNFVWKAVGKISFLFQKICSLSGVYL